MAAIDQWQRQVMNKAIAEIVTQLKPEQLDVLEISGDAWADWNFKSFRSVHFPEFDITRMRLPQKFDLIIAEQVFEHLYDVSSAAKNVRNMLRPGGTFLITTPFLVRHHPFPRDYRRWTKDGLQAFLELSGFTDVQTEAWGNRWCLVANLREWVTYDPETHNLSNDTRFPVVVWGTGRRSRQPIADYVRRLRGKSNA